MKKTGLKKPTKLNLFLGLCISILQEIRGKEPIFLPVEIDNYSFVKKVSNTTNINKYASGIYKRAGKKVFIKTWFGLIYNYEYYDLINEYFATRTLAKILALQKIKGYGYKIKVPKVIDVIRKKGSISLVFEYVNGKKLSQLSKKTKIEVISDILKTFYDVSRSLTGEIKKDLAKQGLSYFLFTFPLFTVIDIISNVKNLRVIMRACFDFLKSIRSIKKQGFTLAFRDLNKDNILVRGSSIYLVDCGRLSLTIYGYDFECLALCLYFRDIYKEVYKNLHYNTNKFLLTHNLIHHAYSYNHSGNNRNESVIKLYELYGNK